MNTDAATVGILDTEEARGAALTLKGLHVPSLSIADIT